MKTPSYVAWLSRFLTIMVCIALACVSVAGLAWLAYLGHQWVVQLIAPPSACRKSPAPTLCQTSESCQVDKPARTGQNTFSHASERVQPLEEPWR